jgi:nicotinamidase-related amidase
VKDALLLVDVVNDFEHEDGEALLSSSRGRREGFVRAVERARADDVPVVYANDFDVWDGDAPRLVRAALAVSDPRVPAPRSHAESCGWFVTLPFPCLTPTDPRTTAVPGMLDHTSVTVSDRVACFD